jgi:hypothetical protein
MSLINYATAIQALTPGAEWSMTNADDYATISWYSVNITQPSQAACDNEIALQTQQAPYESCKQQASGLLYKTDWTTISDVADPTKSNPYLMNQAEFIAYRSQVRALAVNPVINPTFPPVPAAQWGTV